MIAGLDTPIYIALFVIIFMAYGIGAMTGFGSIVLALSAGALVYDLQQLLVILVPLTLVMNFPMAWLNRHYIGWQLLLKTVLPLMLVGLVLGYLIPSWLNSDGVKLVFAALVALFAVRSLRSIQPRQLSTAARRICLVGAGVIHGMFASGGPLLVYALAKSQISKSVFRASLIVVWLVLNCMLTLMYVTDGRLSPALSSVFGLAPAVVLGAIVGNWLHHKVDEQRFMNIVFIVLLIVSMILMLRSLFNLLGLTE
ncbi:MAG: sulfite exporter TauE/SafE family protein [Gammaproteobacteria bacterium]|nr:sulfite exporter TauE/SafE family protein [Gammaproteobacteria bacterium]